MNSAFRRDRETNPFTHKFYSSWPVGIIQGYSCTTLPDQGNGLIDVIFSVKCHMFDCVEWIMFDSYISLSNRRSRTVFIAIGGQAQMHSKNSDISFLAKCSIFKRLASESASQP